MCPLSAFPCGGSLCACSSPRRRHFRPPPPPASISRRSSTSDPAQDLPELRHTVHASEDVISVGASSGARSSARLLWNLALKPCSFVCGRSASSERYLFAGSPSSVIRVWDRQSFEPVGKLAGHTGSVGCLLVIEDGARRWLISSGSACPCSSCAGIERRPPVSQQC